MCTGVESKGQSVAKSRLAVLALLPLFIATAYAQQPAPAATVQQATAVNGITQAAVQLGALSCAARINQVTQYLGFSAQAGALLMAPPAQAD